MMQSSASGVYYSVFFILFISFYTQHILPFPCIDVKSSCIRGSPPTTPCHEQSGSMPLPLHATTTPRHYHTMPLPLHATTTPCHEQSGTMPLPHHATTTPCHEQSRIAIDANVACIHDRCIAVTPSVQHLYFLYVDACWSLSKWRGKPLINNNCTLIVLLIFNLSPVRSCFPSVREVRFFSSLISRLMVGLWPYVWVSFPAWLVGLWSGYDLMYEFSSASGYCSI